MESRLRLWPLARALRIAAAAVVLVASAYGFLAVGSDADRVSRAVASWQLFPQAGRAVGAAARALGHAGLAGASGGMVALAILLATSVAGRWYCSALCPMGSLQDLASLLRGGKRGYRRPHRALRIAALICFLFLVMAGSTGLASWLDPWSLYGRFFAYDLQPLARAAARADLPGLSAWTAAASGLAVLAILALSALFGRWFCGNLCPLGSALGALNRLAPFRIRLDSEACVSCGRCSPVCRASCVSSGEKRLDEARCVYCLACLEACPTGAIYYGTRKRERTRLLAKRAEPRPEGRGASPLTRGQFMAALGGGAAALALAALPGRAFASSSLERMLERSLPKPVTPPGSESSERFLATCTACGLCVARCPSSVLQPSLGQFGARGLFVPRLDYGISYCQFDCTACLDACPSGALGRISPERKRLTKIGNATLVKERCIVFKNRTKCGACAEHCPTGAVRMVVGETGLPEPVFTSSICIGCGACHHACPAKPERAISVSGLAVHETAERPSPALFESEDGGAARTPGVGAEGFPF
jgi:polyferredoxin